ncbi:complement C1q-like protein 3 isoform X1 [Pecten maximus]|uniref:complement C1q-like protein 3 isoform X1 n=1 Tax=Pecten maximus TaxID=6579 RepID=UPI0014586399|nr:complement C1q-like protein 3 isoform X1 [Pecten maximus]
MSPFINVLSVVLAACLVNGAPTGPSPTVSQIYNDHHGDKHVVAFAVGLTHTTTGNSGETVRYDKIFTNLGGGYDQNTGVFTAPKSGIYKFEFHAYDANTDNAMWLELVKNTELLVSLAGFNSHSSAGNSVIVFAGKGERVFVQVRQAQSFTLFGQKNQVYGTFVGHLIGEMDMAQSDSSPSSGNNHFFFGPH